MNKKTILLLIPFAAAALAGCENANPTPPAPQCDSAIVTLDKQSITIEKNETYQLNATISVGNCPIQWASDNTAVATVTNGLVTGVAKGTANISANGVVCVVTVTEEAPVVVKTLTKIEVTKNPTKTEYKVGETFDPAGLEVTASYSDTTSKVVDASCSAPDMSSEGEKTVTVTYTEGEVTQTASFTISVTKSEVTTITPAEAIELMEAAGDGVVVSGLQQVKGICAVGSKYDSQYKQYTTGFDGVSNFKLQFTDTDNILNGGSPDGMEIVVEGYLEKYQGKYQLSYLPESASPTGEKFTPNLISAQEVQHEGVLDSITVSAAHREFYKGSTFVEETVTAHYSDGATATVKATFSGYDMNTLGEQTVTVSYTEKDVTKQTTYTINVIERGSGHAGTLEDPLTTAEAVTIANGLPETTDSKNPIASEGMYVKGVVTEFKETFSADYGNYSIVIGGDFTLWRIKNGPEFAKFNAGDIEVGDEVTAFVYIMNFKGTPESTSNSYVHSVQKAGETKTLQSIEIVGSLTKTSYVEGQTYSSAGLSVKGHYDDGSEGTVAATITLNKTTAALGDTEIIASATFKEITAEPKTFAVTVTEKVPVVGGAVYTFTNDKEDTQNMSSWTSDQFMNHISVEGAEIITGMKGVTNAYIGGNGGSGDGAWNIWNCLKVGKSSAKGEITLLLDGTANFEKIKVSAIGARDDGTLTINNITKDVTKKAIKTDLNPIELEYEIAGGVTELKLSSKDAASNNYGIFITRIEFVEKQEATLDSITADMTNKAYEVGQELSLEGLTVLGHYSDGGEAPITEGYETSLQAGHEMTLADTSLTVSYNDLHADIALVVTDPTLVLESISVSGVKDTYCEGETLGNVVVTAHYQGGTTLDVTSQAELKINDVVVTSEHVMVVGETKLDVSYEGENTSATFTVTEKAIVVEDSVSLTASSLAVPASYGSVKTGDYQYTNLCLNNQGTPDAVQGTGTTSDSRPDKSVLFNSVKFSKPIVGVRLEIGSKQAGTTATANFTFGDSVNPTENKVTMSGSDGTATYKTLSNQNSSIEFKLDAKNCTYFSLNYTSGAVYFSKLTLIFDESFVPAQPAVKSVTVTPETLDLMVGAESTLSAQVEVENGATNAVEWKSNNVDVAVVENGKVTAVGEGEATITATSVFDDTKYDECVVTVSAAQASKFEKVNSTSELVVGQEVVLAAATKNLAISKERQTNNIKATDISRVDNKLAALNESVEVFTLEAGTVDGTFAFKAKSDGKYICAASNSSNYLKTEETKSANSSFAITFDSGVATTTAQGSYSRNEIHCNFGNNPPIFSCYAAGSTTGEKLSIYQVPYNEPTEGLKSITVSGPTKTEYELNEAFNPQGLVVTASYYGDVKDTDVTASATYDAPDMTTEGIKEVVVSYTEGGVTKTDSFSIKVGEVVAEKGTLENPYTGAEAYAIANAMTQTKTAASCGSVYIKGTVQKFNQTFDTKYGNYSFTIDGDFICWQLKNGESGTAFVGGELSIGDEVIVKAEIQKFSDTQMETMGGYIHSITRGTSTIELGSSSSENATIDLKGVSSALNGSTVSFDVSVDAEYEIASVKVNGVDATLVTEGTYSFVVDGPSKIVVETKKVGEKDPEVYKTGTFTAASFSASSTDYAAGKFTSTTKQADATDFVVSFENAANNGKQWDCVGIGSKKGDVTSTMSIGKMDVALCSIGMTFDAFNAGNVTSVIAYASSDEGSTWNEVGSLSKDDYGTGTKEIKLSGTSAGMMYKVVFVMTKASANAIIKISAATFNYIPE